ncbi:MAG: response regulator [Anaerolineae bacterium]
MEERFTQQVRDVLAHLYDHVSLAGHPLMRELPLAQPGEAGDSVRALRLLLMEAVEALRPAAGTPATDAAWRPYQVVRSRYLLGKDFDSIAQELALGVRQVQRELRRGVQAVAQVLWDKRQRRGQAGSAGDNGLEQEISRVAGAAGPISLREVLLSACSAVAPLARHQRVELRGAEAADATVLGDSPLLRQLLVAALSWVIQSPDVGLVSVQCQTGRDEVVLTLAGAAATTAGRGQAGKSDGAALPDDLSMLAQAQHVRVEGQRAPGAATVRLWLPPAQRREAVVAMVEDNPSVVALFTRYLSGHGYRLVPVEDAPQALTRLVEMAPDAVILDVMMRTLDGWEILQAIRAQPALHDTPVVICSVLNDPALAAAIGADAYLHKPVMPAQLLECLARLLAPHSGAAAPSRPAPGT